MPLTIALDIPALHRGCSAEVAALLWCDQLLIGQPALVQLCLLLVNARLRTLALRLLRSNSRALLSHRRPPFPAGSLRAVLLDDAFTPLSQLALTLAKTRTITQARK